MARLRDKMADFCGDLLGLRMPFSFPFDDFLQFPVKKILQLAFFKFFRVKGLEMFELFICLFVFSST